MVCGWLDKINQTRAGDCACVNAYKVGPLPNWTSNRKHNCHTLQIQGTKGNGVSIILILKAYKLLFTKIFVESYN